MLVQWFYRGDVGMGLLVPIYALITVNNLYLHYILMVFLGGAEAFAYLSVIMKITTTVPPSKMGFIHVCEFNLLNYVGC